MVLNDGLVIQTYSKTQWRTIHEAYPHRVVVKKIEQWVKSVIASNIQTSEIFVKFVISYIYSPLCIENVILSNLKYKF